MDGLVSFVHEHFAEIAAALGPDLAQAKANYEQRLERSRESLVRNFPPPNLAQRVWRSRNTWPGAIVFGPFGWLIAFAIWLYYQK